MKIENPYTLDVLMMMMPNNIEKGGKKLLLTEVDEQIFHFFVSENVCQEITDILYI